MIEIRNIKSKSSSITSDPAKIEIKGIEKLSLVRLINKKEIKNKISLRILC